MSERNGWIANRVRFGWILVVAGAALIVGGIALGRLNEVQPWNYGILTGLGIVVIVFGIDRIVRYRPALRDEAAARQLTMSERDERTNLIKARAGSRAYWASALLVYGGLMWVSFASNGSLPKIDDDGLWWFLAAAFLVPFAVYAGSIVVEEQRS
jgi:hypothetical protein